MSTPLHLKIRTGLEAKIQSGELPPGARMPTEAELQAEHGVSRSVAQRVLNDLAQAGLVVRQKRLGTHVAEGARQVNLLRSLDPRIESAGIPGRMVVISGEIMPAGKAEVQVPGLDDDDPVTQLVRVRHDQDDTPIVIEVVAIPFSLAPRLLEEQLESLSVRAHFAKNKVSIARSRMYFDPILLEPRHADLLGIEPGVAVLRRRRMMWQPNGQIAESAAYYLRPDALEFYVEYSEPSH
jgi:DNA-binding GntR family transcriptional regulator